MIMMISDRERRRVVPASRVISAPGRAGQREGVVLFATSDLRPTFFPFRVLPFGGQESREARAPTPRTAGRWPWTLGRYKGAWPVFRKDRRKDPFPVKASRDPGRYHRAGLRGLGPLVALSAYLPWSTVPPPLYAGGRTRLGMSRPARDAILLWPRYHFLCWNLGGKQIN